jgi:hypothetical protein
MIAGYDLLHVSPLLVRSPNPIPRIGVQKALFIWVSRVLVVYLTPTWPCCRYDVLAAVMTEVNTTLTERFNSLFQLQADGTRHEFVEAATLGDLHQVIDWMATYKITLNGVKCPTALNHGGSATCKSPKASGLWDLMPKICQLYVHGGSTGAKVRVLWVYLLHVGWWCSRSV